ncbi:MAG: hypothetical protein ACRDRK_07875, partial [Pseudonocardia sp.]
STRTVYIIFGLCKNISSSSRSVAWGGERLGLEVPVCGIGTPGTRGVFDAGAAAQPPSALEHQFGPLGGEFMV